MPPKASRVGAAASGVDDPAFMFVLSVLKNCESIKPDWNEVAKENGIAYGKNATARFKSIVGNHGLKYADGKVTNPDGAAVGLVTAVVTPNGSEAATPKTPKSRGRKRKAEESDGVDRESPTKKASARKAKKSQPIVKEEDEASAEDQVKEEDAGQKDGKATGEEVKNETEE